jgi:phospholipid/cholesterol/gamma-HCH transport system ATP-binding protein
VAENVEVPIREYYPNIGPVLRDEIAAYKIRMTGLPPEAGPKYPAELSGGMKKRAGLARALALDPDLLFLDEPTAGLGAEGTARVAELIAQLKRELTIVIIEHDMRFLFGLADKINVIHWGQVIAEGTPAQLRDNPWVQRSNLGTLS